MANKARSGNAGQQHNGAVTAGETLDQVAPGQSIEGIRAVVTVALERSLGDIPDPSPCPNCGAARQRELVLWETSTDTLLIDAGAVPGYGCTECGAKFLPSSVAMLLYDAAAEEALAVGDARGSQQFEAQARAAREAIQSNAS